MVGVGSNTLGRQKSRYGANRSKYGAVRTTVNGITFASKREAARYQALWLAEQAGEISTLVLQVPYPLTINSVKVGRYVADFVYQRDGRTVVEDVKGVRTPVYKLKRRLMKALYGIDIQEVA